jgi:hypothetical protein
MNRRLSLLAAAAVAAGVGVWLAVPRLAHAHCDGLDGPVVSDARVALRTRDAAPVLKWVRPGDEEEIRGVFRRTLAVREKGADARELADRYFFETVVRVHRAGEGAPFTGLKPAGQDLGPAIPAADRALRSGSISQVEALLTGAVRDGLRDRYQEVMARRKFQEGDTKAGRAYVAAYVAYIHYVERLYEAARAPSGGHYPAPDDHPPAAPDHAEKHPGPAR